MRYIALVNNFVGYQVLRWLVQQGDPPAVVVLHPVSRGKYREEILDLARAVGAALEDAEQLRAPETLARLGAAGLELGLSVLFGYLLKDELLRLLPRGCLNLHPSLLPFNRGQYPNVWSLVDGTPAGVTLHYVDQGIDTGDIVAQREVAVQPTDTGETLYRRLEAASIELFKEVWPSIRDCEEVPRVTQRIKEGTYHRGRDVDDIDEIDPQRTYRAADLINIIRARTFPPYPGAYFKHGHRKVYLRVQLLYEEQLEEP